MENASIGRKMAILIRAQLTAWVVTALLLLLMALLLFKLELNESKVSLGMTAVYVLSCRSSAAVFSETCSVSFSVSIVFGFSVSDTTG